MRFVATTVWILLLSWAGLAHGQLQIEITQGVDNPTPIAVVPFAWQGTGTAPVDVARVIDSILYAVANLRR